VRGPGQQRDYQQRPLVADPVQDFGDGALLVFLRGDRRGQGGGGHRGHIRVRTGHQTAFFLLGG
jgi:hypothetical protein